MKKRTEHSSQHTTNKTAKHKTSKNIYISLASLAANRIAFVRCTYYDDYFVLDSQSSQSPFNIILEKQKKKETFIHMFSLFFFFIIGKIVVSIRFFYEIFPNDHSDVQRFYAVCLRYHSIPFVSKCF